MTLRQIIKIDEEKCDGCGLCIPNCPEGALQIIDGKARLVSDLSCDGLGACIGHCPKEAITIEQREAEPYDEVKTMKNIIKQGPNVVKAHLEHLRGHGETELLRQAMQVLKEEEEKMKERNIPCGCPGSKMMDFTNNQEGETDETGTRTSQLRQWPVQLHLISPYAPYYRGKNVLLAADCVAYALADFHKDYLKGKSLAIACPKLDSNQDAYVDKITEMIDNSNIKSLTVITMEVPCCQGLFHIAKEGVEKAKRKIPLKYVVISLAGKLLKEDIL